MIVLNSVSKVVGRGRFRRTLLEDVSWEISPRTHVVVLGDRHSGAQALLNLIGGVMVPTSGWIERRATTSIPGGLLRYARQGTIHELVARLSRLYRADSKDISDFIALGLGRRDILHTTPNALPGPVRQQLGILLNYAFPVDFYLFDGPPTGTSNDKRFRSFCERALELRSKEAGIIMLANNGKIARRMEGDMMGALVYRGNVTLYGQLADAITVFETLPPESPPLAEPPSESSIANDDEDILI